MRERRETLGTFAAVKGTKLEAHLGWARERLGDPDALSPHLAATETALIGGPLSGRRLVPAHDGRIRLTGYPDCSPAFCRSAGGYCEGALEMMKVPGHIRVEETACQCAGDLACVFDLAWGCRP